MKFLEGNKLIAEFIGGEPVNKVKGNLLHIHFLLNLDIRKVGMKVGF